MSVVLLVSAILPLSVTNYYPQEEGNPKPDLDVGKVTLSFEPNEGQASAPVRFIARAPGSTIYFSASGVAIDVKSVAADQGVSTDATEKAPRSKLAAFEATVSGASSRPDETSLASPANLLTSSTTVRMQFIGSNPAPEMANGDLLPGKVNYLMGNDPRQWHSNLPTYAGVVYRDLYPGIDLKYEGTASNLKGTYTLAPGADPAGIRWGYGGSSAASVDGAGNLQISYQQSDGQDLALTLTEQAPVAWQEIDGQRRPVSAQYVVDSDGTVSFSLGAYDPSYPLTIDPTLTYSTYFGGIIADQPWGMAMDAQGNTYVVGYTASNNFPAINALQPVTGGQGDAFVVKFNSNGVPVYSTYLGGNYLDYGNGIAVDGAGNAYVTGWTGSSNFPIHNAFQPTYAGNWDGFVTKLNADGSAFIYSTYLGGTGGENAEGIAVDATGNAYITGDTQSADFPTHNAYQPQHASTGSTDLFVTKLNASGQALIYSTYLGGSYGGETGLAIAADANGYAYLTGFTTSDNFPVANAYQPNCYFGAAGCWDVFVTKFSPDGQNLVYSTYLGGNDVEYIDKGFSIITDGAGNAYVTGMTGSTNFPVLNAYQYVYGGQIDAFVSKFSSAGSLLYSSLLGGNNSDVGGAIALDYLGNIYIGGLTISEDFPVVNAIQPAMGGFEDAFATKFNAGGQSLAYSTYLGGTNDREEYGIIGIGVDGSGTAYMVGSTSARDFPTTANAFQPFNNGSYDLFFAKILDPIGPTPTQTVTPAGTSTPTPTVCEVNDYSITQSTGASIVPGTTLLPNSDCDNCTAPMVLPFPVQLYNQTFTQARIGSNGNMQFTSDNALPFNNCLPNSDYNNTIFAFWDDLFLDDAWAGLGVYTSVSGTAPNRILNVEWRASENSATMNINFEVRLYENANGKFDIIYGTMVNNGNSATVGVQRGTGSQFTQYSCNTGVISQGLKLTFTLPPCNATPTPGGNTPTATVLATASPTPPTLLYSTYYGSWERDSVEDIGKDAAGNIYVMGTTFQNDINYGDIYVSKFSPDGQNLLYQTILGGTRIDYGYALAVDAAGNATVAGIATSFDYPLLNPIQATHRMGIYDVVMTKLNPSGQMIFSTYLGGSGTDYADALATDAAGNVYLTGHTDSTDFPTTPGSFQTTNQGMYDGYVTKITPNGSAIMWSTYLGGSYGDEAHDLALDPQGNIYLTGWTASDNFPTLNPFQSTVRDVSGDAFVTKMNPSGTGIIYSTYLGGNNPPGPGEDRGKGIVVDAAGYAYVTGFTQSPNFPITLGSFQPFFRGGHDAFVTKLTPAGNAFVYSTFVGGTLNPPFGDDEAFDIAVDSAGQAHITGKTNSPDFPSLRGVQSQKSDVYDAFVTKLNATGSALSYSTFLGGNFSPPDAGGDDAGTAILIDSAGNAVIGGGTDSLDFPIANAYQPQFAGFGDGFISKISGSNLAPTSTPTATAPAATATASMPPNTPLPNASNTPITGATSTPLPNTTNTPVAQASSTPIVCNIQFSDVQPSSTFYPFVQCLACQGILSGYSDGTFRPDNEITRGQIAKIVSNAAGLSDAPGPQMFEDVPADNTFFTWVNRLALKGYMTGYPCGGEGEPCGADNLAYFRPFANATRGQLAKIVSNAAQFSDVPTGQMFEDVPADNPFYLWIQRLASRGYMSGYQCGSEGEPCGVDNKPYFRPSNNVTRGQTAKIVSSTFFPNCNP